ncbi:MAG: 4-hydroxy-3-methylbut-2-enyl diphosphate reductase [Actinobacteria bacterium]|nr:4-hydroxy-3-methylbut-2-enyl diphosphate reductase [Actinomycetota bacterium]
MRITVAKHAGYCYGVNRALKLAHEATEDSAKPIYTLGPIIHNPQVVESLMRQGVNAVQSVSEVDEGTIIIRTHGVDPKITQAAKSKGLKVIDATCPFVAKAQQRAANLVKNGHNVVIVGERNHPEVAGLLAYTNNKAIVIESAQELDSLSVMERIGVVVQTTQSLENLASIAKGLLNKTKELTIFNTICSATSQRQVTAAKLAGAVDLMLVVGGKNSANTTRLAKICREKNEKTFHIETASEVDKSWLKNAEHIGLTTGASTPDWILKEVADRLRSFIIPR